MTPFLLVFGAAILIAGSFFIGFLARGTILNSKGEVAELRGQIKTLEDDKRKALGRETVAKAALTSRTETLTKQIESVTDKKRDATDTALALASDILDIQRAASESTDLNRLREAITTIATRRPDDR